ncbi:MAG TPA: response regulator [Candidatus Tripitaka californicus]|uniref:response regulator n=1 Tax=Candidatus Tripitaka californicus TaxID=3367616 RepID=UPI0040255456
MPKEILIVEDDADMQLFYKEILKGEDYDITFASSGKEGLHQVQDKRYDLIILDIIMEEPTGDRLFAMIRKNPNSKDVPVIFSTVFKKDTYACTKALGNVSFLEKPFRREELLKEIKKNLQD